MPVCEVVPQEREYLTLPSDVLQPDAVTATGRAVRACGEEADSKLVPTDVQATATVLGRLPVRVGISRGDLGVPAWTQRSEPSHSVRR